MHRMRAFAQTLLCMLACCICEHEDDPMQMMGIRR